MGGPRKVFLLGLDGLPPEVFRRFLAAGRMPRFARLVERAVSADAIPTLPPLTSPGWLAIASGASPGTLGISNLLLPTPGAAPDVIGNGFDRRKARAELLWESMDRAGLDAIVLKYPGSWPPRPGRFVQVDGAGGYADITCRFEATPSEAYIAGGPRAAGTAAPAPHFPAGYRESWRTHTGSGTGVVEVTPRAPRGWSGVPAAAEPAFEVVVPVRQHGRRGRRVLHALAHHRNGVAVLTLAPDKDLTSSPLSLRPGGPWSGWFHDSSGPHPHAYRFKLLHLDLQRRELWLYRTAGHRLAGFARPAELAGELVEKLGPVAEWSGAYDSLNGLVDPDTQLEIYRQHGEWMAGAIEHLATTRPWSGFFTQWHVIEYAHHLVGASLAPEHPLHDPRQAARDLEWLGQVYELADGLLGAVERVIDDDTLLVVASDHGHDLVHTVFYVNHFLRRHGWLATEERDGRPVVDWSRSAAYGLFPGLILLNVAGRWPGGLLAESEVPAVVRDITDALRRLEDPRTGLRPVKMVLDRQDLAAFGQAGPEAPDLFFCMDRGYEPATRIAGGAASEVELEVTVPYREVTSGHGSFFPASPSARTLALLAGPGLRPGSLGGRPISVLDLAPTMASFLGIPPPRNSEGRSLLAPGGAPEALP